MEKITTSLFRFGQSQFSKGFHVTSRQMVHHSLKLSVRVSAVAIQKRYYSNDEYQFLHRSLLPSYHFQPSLLRLPIPDLEKTCQRYLNAQMPILTPEQFNVTKDHVIHFQQGVGMKLHKELRAWDKDNKHTNYVSEPWSETYLRDRVPIPINYNPIMVFADDPKPEYHRLDVRATNMLISLLRFYRTLNAEILDPEVFHLNPKKTNTKRFRQICRYLPSRISSYAAYAFKAFPLDMTQYPSLFHSTRIPHRERDEIRRDPNTRHVTMICKGHIYVVDVIDKDGNIFEPGHLHACVKHVLNDPVPPAEYPLGILTSENRDTWADLRQHLVNLGNEENLHLIDSAITNFVYDLREVSTDQTKWLRSFFHGANGNFWFDKSFSIMFNKDGQAGLNFEHAWGDGIAVLRCFNDMYKDSSEKPWVHPDSKPAPIDTSQYVRRLEMKLDERVKLGINDARKNFDNFVNSLKIDIFRQSKFGKRFLKAEKISPDAIMQLGFQVAYYRQTGESVSSYESCSTAAFKKGRTETMRPNTLATKDVSIALNKRDRPSVAEIRAMIEKASKLHNKLTKEAATGNGFDRHLFGLRHTAERLGEPLPALYRDPSFAAINYNVISTSTVPSTYIRAGAFGPVVKDGYGLGYGIQNSELGSIVTTYPPHRDGTDFVNCLDSAFSDIYNVLYETRKTQ